MCANYTYNQTGEATRVEYIRTTSCAEEKPVVWYYDERMPSIRGEMMSQTSSLASDTYSYDQTGRMTEVQETPSGEGCVTRLYTYNEESNRISQATAKPNSKGECTSESAAVQAHNYDEAGRLTDEGITYDAFGNITKLPEADAEKHTLTTSFYVSNAVATQEQNGVKNEYELDPLGRTLQTTTGATRTISHYDAQGEAVAWTCQAATGSEACEKEKWTRNIPGIDGTITATQTTGSEPVLQLHDLQGNVVATAALSPSETKLLSTYNSTEFGVPNKEKEPPAFAWLGADDISKSLASGVITYGATSYVPQTGTPLQSEQVEPVGEGGSGAGTPYQSTVEPWVWQAAAASAAEAPGREAARQREAEEAAAKAAQEEDNNKVAPEIYRLEVNEGKGHPTAFAAYYKKFILTPGEALYAAQAITAIHHGIIKAPFFPQWANEILHHMPGFDWDKLAGDLDKAVAASAEDDELDGIEISIQGSIRPRYFHLLVLVEAVVI